MTGKFVAIVPLGCLLLASAAGDAAAAAEEDADRLVAEMKAAIEPTRPSTRLMTLSWSGGGKSDTVELVQARTSLPGGARSLTFVTRPEDVRGMAYLVEERVGRPDNVEYRYVPVVRRVRELVPAENYTSFLGTDFTYGDLGFLPRESENDLLGTEKVHGKEAFKVRSTPTPVTRQWYYSSYVTWIDADTKLPLKREFYSPAGAVFKVETFDDVLMVDGVPTPTRITMTDLAAKSTSTLRIDSVSYDRSIPSEWFEPGKLRMLSEAGNAAEKAARSAVETGGAKSDPR